MKRAFFLFFLVALVSKAALAGPWAAIAYVGHPGQYTGPGYWVNYGSYMQWNPGQWQDATYDMAIDEGNFSSAAAVNAAISRCGNARCGYLSVHNGCAAVAVGKVAVGNTSNVGFSTYRINYSSAQSTKEIREAAYHGARAACISTGARCVDVQVACAWQ